MYDLKGKENQNKKTSDFEYLNYFEYVSHCLISTDLLCYLPDFKAEKKSIILKGEVARLHTLVLWVHVTHVIWWQQAETVKLSE